jgi:hypothetical protein
MTGESKDRDLEFPLHGRLERVEIAPPEGAFDYELKLTRAREHLQGLDQEVDRFAKEIEETITEGPDPEAPSNHGVWVTGHDPPRYPIAMLFGDCIQCLRTALDQLAFQLASSFTIPLPDDVAKDSEFPILPDEDRSGGGRGPHLWRSMGVRKTRGMDPAAQQIIESKQPYHAGPAYESELLWRLHELNRIDKHRLLHLHVATFGGFVFDPTRATNVASIGGGAIHSFGGHIDGRTQIARLPLEPIDPREEVHLGARPALDVVFAEGVPLVAGESVLTTAFRLYNHVATDVTPPLAAFLKQRPGS